MKHRTLKVTTYIITKITALISTSDYPMADTSQVQPNDQLISHSGKNLLFSNPPIDDPNASSDDYDSISKTIEKIIETGRSLDIPSDELNDIIFTTKGQNQQHNDAAIFSDPVAHLDLTPCDASIGLEQPNKSSMDATASQSEGNIPLTQGNPKSVNECISVPAQLSSSSTNPSQTKRRRIGKTTNTIESNANQALQSKSVNPNTAKSPKLSSRSYMLHISRPRTTYRRILPKSKIAKAQRTEQNDNSSVCDAIRPGAGQVLQQQQMGHNAANVSTHPNHSYFLRSSHSQAAQAVLPKSQTTKSQGVKEDVNGNACALHMHPIPTEWNFSSLDKKFQAYFASLLQIEDIYGADGTINCEQYARLCRTAEIFNDKKFQKAYEDVIKKHVTKLHKSRKDNMQTTISDCAVRDQSLYALILRRFWAKTRNRNITIDAEIHLWGCFNKLFIYKYTGTKYMLNDAIFTYFCISIISPRCGIQMLHYLDFKVNQYLLSCSDGNNDVNFASMSNEQALTIQEDPKLFEACLYFKDKKIAESFSDINFFETLAHAFSVLISKKSEEIMLKNINSMYDSASYAERCKMYYRCIFHVMGHSEFIKTIKRSCSNIERTGDNERFPGISNKFRDYLLGLHANMFELLSKYVIPYLNESDKSVKNRLSTKIKAICMECDSSIGILHSKLIAGIRNLMTEWFELIDRCGIPNTNALKYDIFVNIQAIFMAYQSISVLTSILIERDQKAPYYVTLQTVFEFIVFSQFDHERVGLFFSEFERKLKKQA